MDDLTNPIVGCSVVCAVLVIFVLGLWLRDEFGGDLPCDVVEQTTRSHQRRRTTTTVDAPTPKTVARRRPAKVVPPTRARPATAAATETERVGVGWVHFSSTSRSGKGASRTQGEAMAKCRLLEETPLSTPAAAAADVDKIEIDLFANIECLRRRQAIVVSGNQRHRASVTLRKLLSNGADNNVRIVFLTDDDDDDDEDQ